MKILGLIAIVLVTFSACQKETLRPCTKPASQPEMPQPQSLGTSDNGSGTTGTGEIVDPNADQDSNVKNPRKGK